MSRINKVNPDHYKTAGRLSADDLARERVKQAEIHQTGPKRRRGSPQPPWMANEVSAAGRETSRAETRRVEPPTTASGASGTASTGKTGRARDSTSRAAAPERPEGPRAHATASPRRQKATTQASQPRAEKPGKRR
jgi:hypothetical protein